MIQNAAPINGQWNGAEWSARVPLDPQRSASPQTMPAVLAAPGETAGVQVQVAVKGSWPAVAAPGLC